MCRATNLVMHHNVVTRHVPSCPQPVYNVQANIIVDAIPAVIDRMWVIVRENAALAEEMSRPQAPPGAC